MTHHGSEGILAVRVGKARGLQPFTNAALVVVHGREIAVRGLLVHEQRQCLAAALDAAVELGVGLRERAGLQIRAPEIEVAEPRIQKAVGLGQNLDRLARVAVLQGDLAFDDLAVGLRLGLAARGESPAERRALWRFRPPRRRSRAARNRIGTALLIASAFSAAAIAGALLSAQEMRVGQRSELPGGSVGVLGREIRGGALLENPRGIGETTLVQRQVAQAGRGPGCARERRSLRASGRFRSPPAAGPVPTGQRPARASAKSVRLLLAPCASCSAVWKSPA